MNRRSFLKTALVGTVAAAAWQPAAAGGILGNSGLLDLENKPSKIAGPSLKGMCTNEENPACVNPLKPGWMHIEFGPWNWNMAATYTCKWALHLYEQIPAAADIQQAIKHPSYDGWWMTLNEPDLTGMSATAAVNLIQKQIDAVIAVDPNAKFCLGGGSQVHAPNTSQPWLPAVWTALPTNYKAHVQAFHTHYYAQTELGDSPQLYLSDSIVRYVKAWRKWMNQQAKDQARQLWLSEIGIVWTDATRSDPRVVLYPLLVQQAMDGLAERWAWYSESKDDGYATLLQPGTSQQTALGQVFAALQPGIYPLIQKAKPS